MLYSYNLRLQLGLISEVGLLAANISDGILAAIKYKRLLYLQSIEAGTTLYQQLFACETDKDLERLIETDKRDAYYSIVAGDDLSDNKLVMRCREHITFLFVCDQRQSYNTFCERRREVLNIPVCLVQEWPTEALLNLYTINDPNPTMHAELFSKINLTLSKQKISSIPLKTFEKYLKLFYELQHKMKESIEAKVQLHKDIHFKFNESFELVSAWEKRVDVLRQQIEESIIKSGENIVANQVANMILAIFLDQIKEQQERSAKEEAEIKIMKYQIQKRLELIKTVLSKIERIVSSFQRTELSQLKKVFKANLVVYFGVECLCILLGEDNHEQKTINRLLADPNLLMRMKAPQILEKRNLKLQSKFKKEIEQYRVEMQENENELAKTIIQWIKSIIEYWSTCEKQRTQEKQYEQAKKILEESTKKHEELKAQVNGVKQIIQEKKSIVEFQLDFKANKEAQLNSLTKRLQNAVKIIPILKNQEVEAKAVLEELKRMEGNLRGNCLLAAVTAVFLPMRPIALKQQLLQLAKSILKEHYVSFSTNFMSELSDKKINSLQNLNLFLLQKSSLPKVVYDPLRKFMLFIQQNMSEPMKDAVIENSEGKTEFESGKIYHVTGEFKADMDKILLVDWSAIAIQEKQEIFLKLAEFKRPQYFVAKKELEIKINRNLMNVVKLKEVLYAQICEKKMKIIEDDNFIEQGQGLRKIEKETVELKHQAEQKLKEIEALTKQLDQFATKIIRLSEIIKHYRPVDLSLILDVCRREGDSVAFLLRWALANINPESWTSFLVAVLIAFNKQYSIYILKDLIHQTPLRSNDSIKVKKPSLVSTKHWETIVKLSAYGGKLNALPESVIKAQKDFQQWCINPQQLHLPGQLLNQKLPFIQHLALIIHLKPKTWGYLAHQLLHQHLPYQLQPLTCKQIFMSCDSKFPIMARYSIEELKRLNLELNQGRCSLARVSKIAYESEMKRIVWKSMQSKEWLILYDFHSKQDLQMLESICYYVMNYDKQAGFRVIIVVDHISGLQPTYQEKLISSSTFLSGISIQLYPQEPSYDTLISETNHIEYQVNISANQSSFSNKQVFNKFYRLVVLCYVAIISRYPRLKAMPLKRILDMLLYIKTRNIAIEFNVFTIVAYLSRMMSGYAADAEQRREIQETWDYIVDQRKIADKVLYGVPLQQQKIDNYIKNNQALTGRQQSHQVRQLKQRFQQAFTQLNSIYQTISNPEEELAFIRIQLGRLPVIITGKQSSNQYFSYFYQKELTEHNARLQALKGMLEDINKSTTKENYLQTLGKTQQQKVMKFVEDISALFHIQIPQNMLRIHLMKIITMLKAQHEFLLYFNPKLPTIIIDPSLINNFPLLVSSYFIDRLCQDDSQQMQKINQYLHFSKFSDVKQVTGEGLYLYNLKCQEFCFHPELKSLSPSYQADGIEPCPVLAIQWRVRQQSAQVDDLEIQIATRGRHREYQCSMEYSTVYVQWGLRQPKLLGGYD